MRLISTFRYFGPLCFILFLAWAFPACSSVSPDARQSYQRAKDEWQKGNQAKAMEWMERAVQESPRFFDAYVALATYQSETNQHAAAVGNWQKSLELRPGESELYFSLGHSHFALQQYAEAKSTWETFLQYSSQDPRAWLALGDAYVELKDYQRGQHHFSEALKLKLSPEEEFAANLGKGLCKLELTLVEDAKTYLKKARDLNPDNRKAMYYFALLKQREIGYNQDSRKLYEQILQQEPRHLQALLQLGEMYRALGYTDKAVQYYSRYLQAGGPSAEIQEYVQIHYEAPRKEQVMICPECGRIQAKGKEICDYDGASLVSYQEP